MPFRDFIGAARQARRRSDRPRCLTEPTDCQLEVFALFGYAAEQVGLLNRATARRLIAQHLEKLGAVHLADLARRRTP
ncbi:MAG: hypothetical protein ACYS0G_05165 [Planctomycetota bacterium]